MTSHLNRLVETVQMRGHNTWFQWDLRKIIPQIIIKYSFLSRALLIYIHSPLTLFTPNTRFWVLCKQSRFNSDAAKCPPETPKTRNGLIQMKRTDRSISQKRGITLSKKIGGLPPLLVWVPLLIVNNYSEFQVNIFSKNRDIRLHLENFKSKKGHNFLKKYWRITSSTGMGSPFDSEQLFWVSSKYLQ